LTHPFNNKTNKPNERKNMNNKFDEPRERNYSRASRGQPVALSRGELTKDLARSVTRRQAFKKFGLGLASLALALALARPVAAVNPASNTSSVSDAAGDAVFPSDLYDGPVPPWIDVVEASVTLTRGVFHFEIKVNADIPANADPGLNPPVNHLGSTFLIQTDLATAGRAKFFGHQERYLLNFLVGALYSVEDSGVGLGLGWHGFMGEPTTGFTEIPLVIRGDTYILEASAASFGNPSSFDWIVASECDPVPAPEEHQRTLLVPDFAPDNGYAHWPAQP
jgi:hypothetical protein